MKFLLVALLIVIIVIAATFTTAQCSVSVSGSSSTISATMINKILEMHNDERRLIKCKEMPMLTWSDDLAAAAQQYIDTCPGLTHSNQQQWRYNNTVCPGTTSKPGYCGENMLYASSTGGESNWPFFVKMWNDEKADWTFAPAPCTGTSGVCGSCAAGKACGHYTQNIWSATKLVGCGWKSGCSNGGFQGACWYFPGGNLWNQAPYEAAAAVPPCVTGAPGVLKKAGASTTCTGCPSTPGGGPPPPGGTPNNNNGNGTGGGAPPGSGDGSSSSTGMIIGIVCGVLGVVLIGVGVFLWYRNRNPDTSDADDEHTAWGSHISNNSDKL